MCVGTINALDPTYLRSAYFTAFYSAFYTHVASVAGLLSEACILAITDSTDQQYHASMYVPTDGYGCARGVGQKSKWQQLLTALSKISTLKVMSDTPDSS